MNPSLGISIPGLASNQRLAWYMMIYVLAWPSGWDTSIASPVNCRTYNHNMTQWYLMYIYIYIYISNYIYLIHIYIYTQYMCIYIYAYQQYAQIYMYIIILYYLTTLSKKSLFQWWNLWSFLGPGLWLRASPAPTLWTIRTEDVPRPGLDSPGRITCDIRSIFHTIWVSYNDLTTTSLESWLVWEIIPKRPNYSG